MAATAVVSADSVSGQEISGRALDAASGDPVALTEVELLDSANARVAATTSNSFGRFVLTAPVAGNYYVVMRRIGYTDTKSPLIMLSGGKRYDVDFEIAPEPFRLERVEVTVENETRDDWLRRTLGKGQSQERRQHGSVAMVEHCSVARAACMRA